MHVTWITECLADVARVEWQLEVACERNMNKKLLKHFPTLTIDQIKGQRKSDKYKDLVKQYGDLGKQKTLKQPMVLEIAESEKPWTQLTPYDTAMNREVPSSGSKRSAQMTVKRGV